MACVVCGAQTAFLNNICPRCGATDADARAVLRAGASAYASARTAAMEMRWSAARKDLALAASLGVSGSQEWKALSDLIAAADPVTSATGSKVYERTRALALQGNYRTDALTSLPDVPAANQLRSLCHQALRLRTRQRQRNWVSTSVIGSICTATVVGAVWSLRPPLTPTGDFKGVSVVRQDTPLSSPTPVSSAVASPVPQLSYPFPERLARRYYNDALELRRAKQYKEAAGLADMAVDSSKTSYLLPDALLLRAELANILQEPEAPQRWARIAYDVPHSSYAPLGLLRAAATARKQNHDPRAAESYMMELMKRYPSSNEARRVRGSSTSPQ